MSSPRNHRKGGVQHDRKNMKGRLSGRAYSFHGKGGHGVAAPEMMLTRPRTVSDLMAAGRSRSGGGAGEVMTAPAKLTKLLLNVAVQRSIGAVKVVMPLEATVEDLIKAVLRRYAEEARLPALPSGDASEFDLHYSQFSLESLDREEKLTELGSRNFFIWPKKAPAEVVAAAETSGGAVTTSTAGCSKEADKASTKGLAWLKFMNFLL